MSARPGVQPRLFGASYSAYVRIVRLALIEKGVDHDLVPVDVFAPDGLPAGYLDRHPFGRIPAFEHGDFALYETGAIVRYVDEAFAGPALQPVDVRERARCNQIIGIADAYAYPHLVWGVYVERVERSTPDEAKIAASLGLARICLKAMSELMGANTFLAGPELSLADLYVAPMIDYFRKAPEGEAMLRDYPALKAWWPRIAMRPSMAATGI